MRDIRELLEEDDVLFRFTTTQNYYGYLYVIGESNSDDISCQLEETLHRMIDADWSDEDIASTLGAHKVDSIEDYDEDDFICIDLDYVIDGLLQSYEEISTDDYMNEEGNKLC